MKIDQQVMKSDLRKLYNKIIKGSLSWRAKKRKLEKG